MTTAEGPIQDTPAEAAAGQTHVFQADVARLLHLMVHSIYSERDIFLRELISNAADACEKLRYEAIANPALTADEEPFAITIGIDKDAKTLTVADNGIGMSEEDLNSALGTIASSGTRAFLDKLGTTEGAEKPQINSDLIGQFGIGFYSAFMVADHVVVETHRAGTDHAYRWTSDGKGSYAIASLPADAAPMRGTKVVLHLNEASQEYLESYRIEQIVRDNSGAIAVPIKLQDAPDAEIKSLSEGTALWAKPKSAVTEDEYKEFYQSLANQYDSPALTIHWRAEGRHEYTVLAFVPGSRPFDLFDPGRKGKAKLYVRRVLISQDAELLPNWLRFMRLVVDSADLPLNVSREMIQESAVFSAIKKGVTNRIVQELTKFAETNKDSYDIVWDNFGSVLKEGLYEDPERRDAIYKLTRFATSTHPEGKRSLADYVAAMKENQTEIYYLLGEDLKRLQSSPQLEGFRARGLEVLMLPDPIDAFWIGNAQGFEGKPFKSVSQGAADLKNIPLEEGKEEPSHETSEEQVSLFARMKEVLADSVEDVRASDRLSESPVCLVAQDRGLDRRLERMLAEHGQLGQATKPVLEVNAAHPLITALSGHTDAAAFEDIVWLLLDEARLMEGEKPADAPAFSARLTRILTKAAQ
ncbi:molecular chaperone HtpG [Beijerinckia sp. L45]|uniref:molecular chaperone HtpG n=1 Tax=Beijerinckia sp. L45 TaxID=1641855 RepID=UPI00131CAC5B|nr:molecular chaperone HtpG [Beijerinckia sp. L45]